MPMKNQDKRESHQKNFFKYLAALVLALFLFFSGFYFGRNKIEENKKEGDVTRGTEIRQSGYAFTSPLLECEVDSGSPILKASELKIKQAIQSEVIEKNPNVSISLYYRDLRNGPWFGINEENTYSPASLLKVPLMIAYYKYSEHNPVIFEKEIAFDKASPEFFQQVNPKDHIEFGKTYTVSQLMEFMIKYSDNEATNLLFQNISQKDLALVFGDLGISMPDIYNINNTMSVKDYATFFRILYNASYLNKDTSEQALNLLSAVEFKNGLVAGVPKDIPISHKFGERESLSSDKQIIRQLHDCGIVYHSKRPYLICVMTKGNNFENLSSIIAKISKIIYEQVEINNL